MRARSAAPDVGDTPRSAACRTVWLRQFLRALAAEGRTVLVSSHVLSEVQQTVDEVVVLSRGRLVRQGPLAELDMQVAGTDNAGRLRVVGSTEGVGHAAFEAGVELHELVASASGLERVFLELTEGGHACRRWCARS